MYFSCVESDTSSSDQQLVCSCACGPSQTTDLPTGSLSPISPSTPSTLTPVQSTPSQTGGQSVTTGGIPPPPPPVLPPFDPVPPPGPPPIAVPPPADDPDDPGKSCNFCVVCADRELRLESAGFVDDNEIFEDQNSVAGTQQNVLADVNSQDLIDQTQRNPLSGQNQNISNGIPQRFVRPQELRTSPKLIDVCAKKYAGPEYDSWSPGASAYPYFQYDTARACATWDWYTYLFDGPLSTPGVKYHTEHVFEAHLV